jgi:FG-GAP-like repeat
MPFLCARLRLLTIVVCLIPSSLMASFPKPLPKFPVGPGGPGAVGDFNGDGKLDLVLVGCDPQTCATGAITVVLGRGDGTFRSPITSLIPVSGGGAVFVGDFNGDHKLDIAFGGNNAVVVALGKGDGTFGATTSYPAPFGGGMVGVADVNGDGKLDLVYSLGGQGVLVFLGNGNGSFQTARSSPADFGCALADLNGDGRSDLISPFGIHFANKDGTFQPLTPINLVYPCPAIADFNGDGKLDLAVPAPFGITVFFGNGNGTFQPPTTSHLGIDMNGLTSGAFHTADFNGDGKPDLFVNKGFVGTILLNSGGGKFAYPSAASYQFSEAEFVLGDFNGDGRTDVTTEFFRTGSGFFARIGLVAPNGTLPLPRAYFLENGFSDSPFASLVTGDFNNDGRLDLATVSSQYSGFNTGELNVLLARRAGVFQPPFASITGDIGTNFVATADLNHDGKLDLVMASSSSVDVRLGLGNGTFQKPVSYPAVGPASIAIADFNDDGIPDLAVNSTNFFGTFPGQILLGNGDGTFRSGPSLPTGIRSLAAVDFNHDGKIDLAAGVSGGVGVMLGNGDGTFQPVLVLHQGPSGSLVLADFNNDGELDVAGVGVTALGTVVSVYLGNGKGAISWAHNSFISPSGGPSTAATADFDSDGLTDIAVTTSSGVAVAKGKGTGYFQPVFFYPVTTGGGLVAADLDGNGTPDLALTTSPLTNTVAILPNQP